MKKTIRNLLVLAAFLTVCLATSVPAMAMTVRCYTISSGYTTVYSNRSLTSRYGTIYPSDELTFWGYDSSYGVAQVSYPTSRGSKTGYIPLGSILTSTSGTRYTAKGQTTTYKRPNGGSYGYVAPGDSVLVLGTSGGYTQIQYNVSYGYKFAFVKTSDVDRMINGERENNKNTNQGNGAVSLSVPVFRQYDGRWKKVKIGTKTIGQIGCTTTCIAMKYSYQTGVTTYPHKMKNKLSYSNNDIIWSSVTKLGYTLTGQYRCKITSSILQTIANQLRNGRPVIVGGVPTKNGSNQHWIVVTGYNGRGLSASNFTIIDPNSSSRNTLQAFLNYKPYVYRLIY